MGGTKKKDSCCKTFAQFLFSHIGLAVMVVLYCVAGGFIFEHLEKKNEEQICFDARSEFSPMETKTINSTMKIFSDYGGVTTDANRELMEVQIRSILDTYRSNTLAIGYDGRDCDAYGETDGPKYQWSWPGALMFSVTVVSTIGYGNIAPKTVWGRLVCIAYAVLGIPLMLLCLANIGDVLADIFRFIYSKICCCGCCKSKKKKDRQQQLAETKNHMDNQWNNGEKGGMIAGSAPMGTEYSRLPNKSPTESTVTSDTNMTPSRPSSARSGMRPFSPLRRAVKIVPLDVKALHQGPIKNEPVLLDDDSDDDDDDDDDLDEKKITVPLTITMIVIGGYIFGGAVLFGLWEGWDLLQAAYFCFITLATIGFGDVVPGTDFDNPQAQMQMLLGSVYVMFGMAILSMCFTLMQEEIIAKCRWIGQKLGILEKSEE